MSLSNTPYPLLSTGLTQEDRKFVDWDIKHKSKQTFTMEADNMIPD